MLRKLIFSDKLNHKITRHALFWVIYCIFFFVQSITPSSPGSFRQPGMYYDALLSTCCFVPACFISVYTGLYIVWPYFVKKNKYLSGLLSVVGVFLFDIMMNFFTSAIYYTNAVHAWGEPSTNNKIGLGYLNAIWAITLMGVAMGIKICKDCYWQQRENLDIARKKTRTDLDLQKSRLQPAYLYSSLSSIHNGIVHGAEHSDEMILKLSDVLSYTLYYSDEETVNIQSEIQAVNEFIHLEKLKHGKRLLIELRAELNNNGYQLPPMLILSFLQQVTTISGEYNGSLWDIGITVSDQMGYPSINISVSGNHSNVFDSSVITEYCRAISNRLSSVYRPDEFVFDCNDTGDRLVLNVSIFKTNLPIYEPA